MAGYWLRVCLQRIGLHSLLVTRYPQLANALLLKRDETPSPVPKVKFRWSDSEVAESRSLRKEFSGFDF